MTALLVVAGLVGADIATYRALRSFLVGRLDQQLTALSASTTRLLVDRGLDPGALGGRLGFAADVGAYVELRDPAGHVVVSGAARRPDEAPSAPPRLPDVLQAPASGSGTSGGDGGERYFQASAAGSGPDYEVRVSPLPFGSGTVVAALPLTDVQATVHRLVLVELAVSGAVVILVLLAGAWLVRLSLRPLDDMTRTADEIAGGRLDLRVEETEATTEVGRLGGAFNAMLGRIEVAFAERQASEDRLRRFVADASHELRTPLTSIRGYAELFHRGADRRPEDLAKAMHRIEDEAVRMSLLVDDLLLLARLDQGRPLERAPVDLGTVVSDAVDAARAVEPDRTVRLAVEGPCVVVGDRLRLRQVFDNLLANVRAHTPAGAPVHVRLAAAGDDIVAEVIDSGPGLDPAVAARVFERFYRADPARSHHAGGVGLGLSIVQAIVAAHDGTVDLRSAPGEGTTVTVRLPRRAAPPPEPDGAASQEAPGGVPAGSQPPSGGW